MDEIIAYNITDDDEPSPEKKKKPNTLKAMPRLNLFDRLAEREAAAPRTEAAKPKPVIVPEVRHGDQRPPPTQTLPPPKPEPPVTAVQAPTAAPPSGLAALSVPVLVMLALLAFVLAGILGGSAYLAYRQINKPAIVAATPTPKAPSPTPLPSPSLKAAPVTPPPATAPPTDVPVPGQRYVVQPGDTLITIGDRIGKDWRAIAAANNNISDPNLIHPGDILVIP